MKRVVALLAGLAFFIAGCGDGCKGTVQKKTEVNDTATLRVHNGPGPNDFCTVTYSRAALAGCLAGLQYPQCSK